ncbi:hypothetical protein CJ195_12000 [Bacillus sp. UMB0899]|nr:hypothetical protein CJ195_12000 [Bacillus sp. UMB0899]
MKKDLTEKDGRLILLLTLLGAFAAVVMIPYQKEIGLLDILIETYHITFTIAVIINVIQVTLYTLIASAIGLHLAKPVGFNVSYLRGLVYKNKTVPLSLKWIMIAILGSAVGTLIIAVLEVKVFQPHLVTQLVPNVSLWFNLIKQTEHI